MDVFIRVSKHCFCFEVILVQVLSLVHDAQPLVAVTFGTKQNDEYFRKRDPQESLRKIRMQCTSQPVCDVTLGDTIDLDGCYIMNSSMLTRLQVSHDLFS